MLTGAQDAENDLAAVLAHEHDLHTTVANDEQGVARVVLEQNDAALRIALLARQLREALQLGVLELGEERNRPQEVGYLHQSECSAKKNLVVAKPNGSNHSRLGVRRMDADSGVASRIN